MLKAILLSICLLVLSCGFSGCASGPEYRTIAERIPPLPEHSGRIYFYRTSIVGPFYRPDIQLDGKVVGTSVSGGFFFVDQPAGDHVIALAAGAEHGMKLSLDERQTRYVEGFVQIGLLESNMILKIADPTEGEKAVRGLKYTGPELPAASPSP